MDNKENFNLELIKDWDELLKDFIFLKKEALTDNDMHMVANYNAFIDGVKSAIKVYRDHLEHQFYYQILIQCEIDDLIINYPIT